MCSMKGATWTQLSRWWNPGNEADQFIMNTSKSHETLKLYYKSTIWSRSLQNAIKLHTHANPTVPTKAHMKTEMASIQCWIFKEYST